MSGLLRAVLVEQSDSSRKEGPVVPLLLTLGMKESVADGAAQCGNSILHGVGAVLHH